ncbi:unnamed protein product [Lampetra fluviatilis]
MHRGSSRIVEGYDAKGACVASSDAGGRYGGPDVAVETNWATFLHRCSRSSVGRDAPSPAVGRSPPVRSPRTASDPIRYLELSSVELGRSLDAVTVKLAH